MILCPAVPPETKRNASHRLRLAARLGGVGDFVAADVADCRVPAHLQTVEGRLHHLQVLHSTHRI